MRRQPDWNGRQFRSSKGSPTRGINLVPSSFRRNQKASAWGTLGAHSPPSRFFRFPLRLSSLGFARILRLPRLPGLRGISRKRTRNAQAIGSSPVVGSKLRIHQCSVRSSVGTCGLEPSSRPSIDQCFARACCQLAGRERLRPERPYILGMLAGLGQWYEGVNLDLRPWLNNHPPHKRLHDLRPFLGR